MQIGPYKISNPYILAPMAGVSQMPFRKLALSLGAGLAPTELISAKGLFFANARTKSYLMYDKSIENPFCVQLFGGDEESMSKASEKAMLMGAQIIDINMGCPVKKVTKTNAGSALLCDIKRAQNIVKAMIKAVGPKIPITAKIRSGWDDVSLNYLDMGKALEDVGLSAIALHARTRAQGYSGYANWNHIKKLKAHLSIPVIGNGDIKSLSEAKKIKEEIGCDAIMIGRSALGNPWIFLNKEVLPYERLSTIKTHLLEHMALQKLISEDINRPYCSKIAIKSFRSHLIWYSKGLSGGAIFRQKIMTTEDEHEIFDIIDKFFLQTNLSKDCDIMEDDGINYAQAFG